MSTLSYSGNDAHRIQSHADFIVELLPEPPKTWLQLDVLPDEDWAKDRMQKLRHCSALEQVEKVQPAEARGDHDQLVWTYRVRPAAYEIAQETVRHRDPMLPCGHSGLQNVDDGYECGFVACGKTWAREEVDR